MDTFIEIIKDFGVKKLNLTLIEVDNFVFILLLASITITLIVFLFKFYRAIFRWKEKRVSNNDLAPYFSNNEMILATKYYLPTKYQNVSPSEDEEPGRTYIASAKNLIIPLFLKTAFRNDADDNKFYLILADSGMGKTTFLINLYLAYQKQWKKKYKIRLYPLGSSASLKDIAKIEDEEKKDTILLLDAFDEDNEAVKDYQKRMIEILKTVWRFREIVITCRTQFFPSQIEEPKEAKQIKFSGNGGEYNFQKLYLSVFDEKDIKKYLRKRYKFFNPFNIKKYRKAFNIVQKSPNLMVRPMLLSAIDDLIIEDQEFRYSYQIYETLIQVWINREANKPGIKERYGTTEKFTQILDTFSENFAIYLYQNLENNKGFMCKIEVNPFLPGELQLLDLEEIYRDIGPKESQSRSLLNRNADGYYKFSHKSILEYFLAKKAIEDFHFFQTFDFTGMNAAKRFYKEMLYTKFLSAFDLGDGDRYPVGFRLDGPKRKQRNLDTVTYSGFFGADVIHITNAPAELLYRILLDNEIKISLPTFVYFAIRLIIRRLLSPPELRRIVKEVQAIESVEDRRCLKDTVRVAIVDCTDIMIGSMISAEHSRFIGSIYTTPRNLSSISSDIMILRDRWSELLVASDAGIPLAADHYMKLGLSKDIDLSYEAVHHKADRVIKAITTRTVNRTIGLVDMSLDVINRCNPREHDDWRRHVVFALTDAFK